jgi:predicted kinase
MRDDRSRSLDQDQNGATDWRGAEAPAGRQDLSRRLDSLPDGHPSSRNEADGSPRSPATRLRDLDRWPDTADTRPYTDAEWSEHLAEVRAGLEKAHADGLSTDHLYALDDDGEAWTPSRREIHRVIIEHFYDASAAVPCERRAIVAGGLAGAGKTTVLENYGAIDRSRYLTINPDDIKVEMTKRGLVPAVDGLAPMEASDLCHEESSHIAKQLALRAMADGKNVIWDITMSTRASAERRIDDLRAAGYQEIKGVFVDIPIDVSVRRADARHRQDQDKFRAGDGLGGRYVPPEVTAAQEDARWGSKNRGTFEQLKPRFDDWVRFDNSVDGRNAVLVERSPSPDSPEETAS